MTKHRIEKTAPGTLNIDVTASGDEKADLLNNFQKCQSGQCGCPSDEYAKLEAIDITTDEDGIHIELTSKQDAEIDLEEVEKCLSWSKNQVRAK